MYQKNDRLMRKLLLCSLFCLLSSFTAAQAESFTFTVSPSTGQCLRGGSTQVSGSGSYYSTWKSAQTSPQLTLSTSKNDMWIHGDAASVHYYGGVRFQLSVTSGYVITGYSFDFTGYEGNSNSYTTRRAMTVEDADGKTYACTATAAGQLSVSDLETQTTSFSVIAPEAGNGNVLVTNFKVFVEKYDYNSLQPFKPTQIVDGAFAEGTEWYTMEVKAFGRQAYRASDTSVKLQSNNPLLEDDAYLWCFVGDRNTGYKVYNKAAGPGKCYVSPRTGMADGSYARFVAEEGLNTTQYDPYWYFTESTYDPSLAGYKALFMSPSANASYALNDYQENGELKLWNGRGLGSTVTICEQGRVVPVDGARTVKVFDNANSSVPYRIPALAKTADGKLILVVDYRYSKADIGNGPIDLRYKTSTDNGRTWSAEGTDLGDGDASKSAGNQWDYAFGDPSIVADCEDPNEVLVIAVGGHVGYFSSTNANPQHVVRFRSHDGGASWTKGDSLTYQIYNLYNNSVMGKAVGIFLTSGKIMQSRYVKAGSHYRLYIAHPFRGEKGQADFVIYSDDFGETWKVLGGAGTIASTGADESKIEELPDGSVVISSRNQGGGRVVNVFTYTNSKTAEGTWSTTATPAPMANGKVNACNGEILVLPAKRNSDGKQLYVAIQSVPMSTSRQYVGFYYKELASAADFITGAKMAANWKNGLRVTQASSCYSTMVLMDDGLVGFVYEENGYNGGYDIIFKALSLDTITAGAYSLDLSFTDRSEYLRSSLNERVPEVMPGGGNIVGQVSDLSSFQADREAFEKAPTQEGMEALWATYQTGLPTVSLKEGRPYRLKNLKEYTAGNTRYMALDNSTLTTHTNAAPSTDELFVFQPCATQGQYYIYSPQYERYVGRTGANETKLTYVTNTALAGRYVVTSDVTGRSALVCQNATGTNSALHCASDGRLVPWTTAADASGWNIVAVTEWDIPMTDCQNFSAAAPYMPFAYTLPEGVTAYAVTTDAETAGAKATAYGSGMVGTGTPLLLLSKNTAGTITVAVADAEPTEAPTIANNLKGSYRGITVDTGDENGVLGFADGRLGFRQAQGAVVPLNAAYLQGVGSEGKLLDLKDTTVGIVNVSSAPSSASAVFDLQGRRVVNSARGIYIQDGRKLIR